jgi:hypothetical protein
LHQSSSNDENLNNNNNNNNGSGFNNNNNNNFLNNNIVNGGSSSSAAVEPVAGSSRLVMQLEPSSSFETPAFKIKPNNVNQQTPDSGVSSNAPGSSSNLNGFSSSSGPSNRKNHHNHLDISKRIESVKRNFNDDDSD